MESELQQGLQGAASCCCWCMLLCSGEAAGDGLGLGWSEETAEDDACCVLLRFLGFSCCHGACLGAGRGAGAACVAWGCCMLLLFAWAAGSPRGPDAGSASMPRAASSRDSNSRSKSSCPTSIAKLT
jgi:hypothetical protein